MNIIARKNVVACATCGRLVGGYWPAGNRSMQPRPHKNDKRAWCVGTYRAAAKVVRAAAVPPGTVKP